MACRLPGAADPRALWRTLRAGRESIVQLSDSELLAAGVDPELLRDRRYVKAAAVLEDVAGFDPGFFGLSHREATLLDPQHRVLLECAFEALAAAGYGPGCLDGAVGVFVGARHSDYLEAAVPDLEATPLGELQRRLGGGRDYLAPRLSHHLDLRGPSVNVNTASSTSLVAVHLAGQSLLTGECDLALAGGVALRLPQRVGYLHQEGMILSPNGHTRSFDTAAAGTLFGGGAGIVALRRLEDARAAADPVLAIVCGSAVNHDGRDRAGFSAPSFSGQCRLLAEALAAAGVEPDEVSYVEGHGTATPLGDAVELEALQEVFSGTGRPPASCALGSIKSNIGHAGHAAGIAGLIKVMLMLEHRALPPSLHFERPNPLLDLASSPLAVNTRLRPWTSPPGVPRRAGVTSLGLGGTNAHVVLEEAPEWARDPDRARRPAAAPPAPYRRRRCWLPLRSPAPSGRNVAPTREHPLLGRRLASPLPQLQLTASLHIDSLPWLDQHRIGGRAALPAAAIVEMALSAAQWSLAEGMLSEEASPSSGTGGAEGSIELRRLELLRPVIVPEQGALALHAVVDPAPSREHARWELWSCPDAGGATAAAWQLHARCELRRPPDAAVPPLDAAAVRARCTSADLAARRAEKTARGIAHGAAFEILSGLWRGDGEGLGEIEGSSPEPGLLLSPPLLDACLQAAAVVEEPAAPPPPAPLLPWRLERVAFYGPLPERLWCHVVSGAREAVPGAPPVDLRIAGEDGRVRLEVEGYRRRRAAPDAVRPQARGGGGEEDVFRIDWKPLPTPAAPAAAADGRPWLLLGGEDGPDDRLARHLEGLGRRTIRVDISGSEASREGRHQVDPADGVAVRRLVGEVARRAGGGLAGVVYAPPAAASPAGESRREAGSDLLDPASRLCAGLLHLVQALAAEAAGGRIWIVTRGAAGMGAERLPISALAQAPLWGLGQVVSREQPSRWGGLIDLDPAPGRGEEELLARLLVSAGSERLVSVRGGEVWVPRLVAAPELLGGERTPAVRPDSTYAVTGGLGALGQRLAGWLIAHGARFLLLIGRSAPDPPTQARIAAWQRQGVRVVVAAVDVARADELARALDLAAAGMPPLRGVVHAAGVLDEGLLAVQTRERIERVLAPKVAGAWNLHRLTRDGGLDFFVLCSSVSGLTGPPGLAGYAAANRFLDALAHFRRGRSLPAVSIDWGRWRGTGMARRDGDRPAAAPAAALDPERGADLFGRCLECDLPQVVVWPFQPHRLAERFPGGRLPPFLAEVGRPPAQTASPQAPPPHAERSRLHDLAPDERRRAVEAAVVEQVAELLGSSPDGLEDRERGGRDLGLDSLSLLVLRERLEQRLGVALSGVELLSSPDRDGLTAAVLAALETAAADGDPCLVTLAAGGSEAPLALVHGILGDVESFRPLARRLAGGVPVIGLRSAALAGGNEPPARVEAMAERYVAALRQSFPRGPYRLAGHSFGGWVALAMARRLLAAGEEVPLVVLLDTLVPPLPSRGDPAVPPATVDDAAALALVLRLASYPLRDPQAPTAEVLRNLAPAERLERAAELLGRRYDSTDAGLLARLARAVRANVEALQAHRPLPYSGRTVLLRACDPLPDGVIGVESGWTPPPAGDERAEETAWRAFAPSLEIRRIEGDHFGLLGETHVDSLAWVVGELLAAGPPPQPPGTPPPQHPEGELNRDRRPRD